MHHRKLTLALAAMAVITVVACEDDDDILTPVSKIVNFSATMNGAAESPPVTTSGTGSFTATLDTSTNVFTYNVTYSGLGSNVTLGHIHGPCSSCTTAGAILNFATVAGGTFVTGALSGTATGTVTLNAATQITTTVNGDSLRKLLLANNTYVNIHTATNGGGEIRGQIIKQ
jgi:hypothetical protein